MSNLVRGIAIPLFDKLSTNDESAKRGAFLLSPDQVHASICRELSRLFNTRSRLMPSEFAQSSGTTIDYGIPDFSAFSAERPEDVAVIASGILQAIGHYETRLSKVNVNVLAAPLRGDPARIIVSGNVTIGLEVQRLSFELQLNGQQ